MNYLDDKYRVVNEKCLSLQVDDTVNEHGSILPKAGLPEGSGLLLSVNEIRDDVARYTIGGPFDNLDEALVFANNHVETHPEQRLNIIKDLYFGQNIFNTAYRKQKKQEALEKDRRNELHTTWICFALGITLAALILTFQTSPVWAGTTLLLIIVLCILSWGSDLVMQTFLPVIIAIVSSVVYKLL